MAVLARWDFRVRNMPGAMLTMHTVSLDLDDVLVAGPTVDGIESATVPAAVGTNVTFEAVGLAMGRDGKITQVVVALEAGICLLGNACSRE